MSKKSILILALVIGLAVTGLVVLNPAGQKSSLSKSPAGGQQTVKNAQPSETLKDYTDPSGFTLSYPDNLSLVKIDIADESTYADIQLTSKEVSGSLNLKISDSKFSTIDDWLKLNKGTSKEVKLGNLKGTEITTGDRLLLGSLDKGIFFTIEMPLLEKDFWMKVYNKVLASFSFNSPENVSANTSNSDVAFEGEEVIE